MSIHHSTKKSTYSPFLASERGKIDAYLKMGKKPAEITRLIGSHRLTISRDMTRGSAFQEQEKNGDLIYSRLYFPDSG